MWISNCKLIVYNQISCDNWVEFPRIVFGRYSNRKFVELILLKKREKDIEIPFLFLEVGKRTNKLSEILNHIQVCFLSKKTLINSTISHFVNQSLINSEEPHKMVLILYIGIVLYAYICRWGEHQGVAEELKGGPQGEPFLPVNHRSPTSLSVVSLLQWTNYLSVILVFMFVVTELTICACIWEYFCFLIFQLNLLYHYILISRFTFCFKGLDNDMSYKSI